MAFAVSLLGRTRNVSVLRGSGSGGPEQVEGVGHEVRGRAMDRERQKAACILLSRKGSGEPGAKAERVRLKPLHPPPQPQEAKARRAGQAGHAAEASRESAGSTKGDRTPLAAYNSVPTEEYSGRKSGCRGGVPWQRVPGR